MCANRLINSCMVINRHLIIVRPGFSHLRLWLRWNSKLINADNKYFVIDKELLYKKKRLSVIYIVNDPLFYSCYIISTKWYYIKSKLLLEFPDFNIQIVMRNIFSSSTLLQQKEEVGIIDKPYILRNYKSITFVTSKKNILSPTALTDERRTNTNL